MRKSLKSVKKIFEMGLIHNRGLKPTNFTIYYPLPPVFGSMCSALLQYWNLTYLWWSPSWLSSPPPPLSWPWFWPLLPPAIYSSNCLFQLFLLLLAQVEVLSAMIMVIMSSVAPLLDKTNLGSKQNFDQQILGPKFFWYTTFLGPNKFWVQKKYWGNNFFRSTLYCLVFKDTCQTFSTHFPNSFQTPFTHLPDTFQKTSSHRLKSLSILSLYWGVELV